MRLNIAVAVFSLCLGLVALQSYQNAVVRGEQAATQMLASFEM